jgi:PAS domain S-box-containing protein
MSEALSDSIQVLHVDDEPDLADMAAEFIRQQDDQFDVETATTASEALEWLKENTVHCIVSDFDMPGKNGIEFLETVRADNPELPFILYTGKGSEEVASEAISAGVTDYLQKESGSSQYEVLANRIKNVVSQFHTRRELDRSRDLLEHTEKLADVGGWEADVETDEQRWTRGTYKIHDLDPGSDFDPTVDMGVAFYHPDDQDEIERLVRRCGELGEEYDVELRLCTADDRIRWVRSTGEPIRKDGDIVTVRGAIQDITEGKAREQELQSRNQLLQVVLDNVEAAIWVRDLDNRFEMVNQNFRDLFGLADETVVVGKRPTDLFPEEVAAQFRENDQQVIATEEPAEIQEDVATERGVRTYLTRITPLFDDNGELDAMCGVASDITAQ